MGMFEEEKILQKIGEAENLIEKKFLDNLLNYNIEDLAEYEKNYRFVRIFRVLKIVYDKEENSNSKLVSVFHAVLPFCNNLVLILKGKETYVELYIGVRSKNNIGIASEVLQDAFLGNFPGSKIEAVPVEGVETVFNKGDKYSEEQWAAEFQKRNIAIINTIPSMREEKENGFVQGLEKFIDTMKGTEYLCEILASPLSREEIETRVSGLEQLYSALYPFSKKTMSHGHNEGHTLTEGISENISDSISTGISLALGTNNQISKGTNSGFNLGAHMLLGFGFMKGENEGFSSGTSRNESDTRTSSHQTTSGWNQSKATTTGVTDNLTVEYRNKSIDNLLEKTEKQLMRLKEGAAYGLWECAAYFVSQKKKTVAIAASTFSSLVMGDSSGVENTHFNIFGSELLHTEKLWETLRYCEHPRFCVPVITQNEKKQLITPTTYINGKELVLFFSLPKKSISGITVSNMAEFGRNIFKYRNYNEKIINIGNIFHMGRSEKTPLELELDSFSSHCFIAGSTGSGKSNTVYQLIEKISLREQKVPFLVIEPAKGEYRNEFRRVEGINLFTTNPTMDQLIKLNPFQFSEGIHVLEHLDRLVEIFNTCWEMYAAMPAILKEAIEKAYIDKGWDLLNSIYVKSGKVLYPTFADVLDELPEIINSSEYSADTKGDYIGALVTRVNSMTNGIYGQIFCDEYEIEEEKLFDENTIIDLSRVGSSETKSLIMGILVLKLTEYRVANAKRGNAELRHITILEEAHNLLKNVDNIKSTAGNSVVAKSVEMLVNSIAEMRTYGEGFIIVDQSPTAVDLAAIKNTNTKIIMRLPEKEDCKLAGYALSLKEHQIEELPKLETGVAVVMQNNWSESVLGKIDKYSHDYEAYDSLLTFENIKDFKSAVVTELLNQFVVSDVGSVERIFDVIDRYEIGFGKKEEMRRWVKGLCTQLENEFDSRLLGNNLLRMIGCKELFEMAEQEIIVDEGGELNEESLQKWGARISTELSRYIVLEEEQKQLAIQYMLHAKRFDRCKISYDSLYREIYEVK